MKFTKIMWKYKWFMIIKKYIRPIYFCIQKMKYKKELIKNSSLKNKYYGMQCFVFGTGLSLKYIDLSLFSNKYTFGCNYLFMHKEFKKMEVKFYSIIGSIFELWNSPVPWDMPDILFRKLENAFEEETSHLFLHTSVETYIYKNKHFRNWPITYVQNNVTKNDDNLYKYDLDKPNDFMLGSHYFMIAAAIYMGFKEIYLFGLGYTYAPIQRCHFYDNDKALEDSKRIKDTPVDVKNHYIKNIAEKCGVQIYNVVPDGFESPIYDTIRLNDVYKIIN